MNEKYFIHLVSMQLASILTRLARLSGIAAMSFLRSLNLWGVVVALAFVALVPMGLAEAQERSRYSSHAVEIPRVATPRRGTPIRDAKITLVSC